MSNDRRQHGDDPDVRVVEAPLLRACAGRFPDGFELEPHEHERPVVAIALSGAIEEVFPRRSDTCGPATVFTEPAGERHRGRVGREGVHVVLVQPRHAGSDLWRSATGLLDGIHRFRDGRVAALAGRLDAELRRGEDTSDLQVQGLALELVALAAREPEPAERSEPLWLDRIRELLHARFREAPSIEEMATEAGVHPAHLARVFRRHHRVPLGTYVRRLRLDWAARRLVESDAPISAIALQAGFYDQSHFTHAFRRHTGLTPARYREARPR